MRSPHHRTGAQKYRTGKSDYEKNRWRFGNWFGWRLVKGKRGSDEDNPEIPETTLADVWPAE